MSDDIVDIVDIIDLKPSLLRDLKNLYKNLEKDNNNDYNVIIKVDQKNFKAHSVILKLRSEYFHNLINNELAKKMVKFSKKLTLEISDINSNVFASCLKYIYTGKFSLQEDDDVIFFAITSEDYYICVRPYKDVLPEKLVEQLEEYYLTKKTSPPPDALPPREMKEKNPNWLKRRHSMGKQPPGLQRKNTLAKPPVVVQPRIRTVSKIINNQKIKRISRWIDGNESNELGDSNNNHD
ncbi:unnamed protein product [Rhizophagus irregularis]|uniref:BTB domain-containing protein n=1 Tax=Rhizophagus irregularis TaxID=588596 RepID=A0A915YYC8_9GLOM|nr:unnamed protein product [Rhizophagus irregularis]CAB5193087.1 unnamed protein product [Rhizophagus irregularis]CAB5352158.1 unnamed protein product [Rhizophagus irregularis]